MKKDLNAGYLLQVKQKSDLEYHMETVVSLSDLIKRIIELTIDCATFQIYKCSWITEYKSKETE